MPKALIVEDEPEANELLSMLVQLRGYQTDSAFTGSEALRKVDRNRPDIVFLDLMLPDWNGYDICRTLKASRETCGIPVVMVTARLAAENRLQGFRAGATDYVPKPYTPDEIYGAMAHADAWWKRLADRDREGSIPLDARADFCHLRDISRLWSLLLERTPLCQEAARGLDQVLMDIALRAVEWGRARNLGLVATMHYRWDEQSLIITLRDEADWFVEDSPLRTEGLGGLINRGRFDEVAYNESAQQIVMTRLFSV